MDHTNYYNSIAPGYDELHKSEQLEKLDFVRHKLSELNIHLPKNAKILDVGCGTGISSDYFAEKGFKVTGIDPAKKLLKQNKNNLCKFIAAPAEKMPFKEKSFDTIISFTAIQNFDDVEKGLHEIKRVGKSTFILTFLKGTKTEELTEKIRKAFPNSKEFETRKDKIFICANL